MACACDFAIMPRCVKGSQIWANHWSSILFDPQPLFNSLQHPVHVPASFPNMVHPSLRRESTFRKLSAETNFFALCVVLGV